MNDTPTSTEAEAVAKAVTGAGTPDNVKVSRPAKQVLWAVFAALFMVTLGVAVVIGALASGALWPNSDAVAIARINGLKWIGWLLCGDVALLVAAIAIPGGLGTVKASAGNNSIDLSGGGK